MLSAVWEPKRTTIFTVAEHVVERGEGCKEVNLLGIGLEIIVGGGGVMSQVNPPRAGDGASSHEGQRFSAGDDSGVGSLDNAMSPQHVSANTPLLANPHVDSLGSGG